jgi:hypothetical protein
MAFPPKQSGNPAVDAARSKFMGPDMEPDMGDPGEGAEKDPVENLSPQAQMVFQKYLDQGILPVMDDLMAEGLAEDEAVAVLDLLDLAMS